MVSISMLRRGAGGLGLAEIAGGGIVNIVGQHRRLQQWVDEMARLCEPDRVVWIDGSEEEKERLTDEAVATGEMIALDQEKLPGCLYHRTAVNDVARTEDLTFICTTRHEDAGPTNNWMPPAEGYRRAGEIFAGSMKGTHDVRHPLLDGAGRLALQQDRRRVDRQHLRRAEHADHDPRRRAGARTAWRRRRVHPVPARQGRSRHPAAG